MSDDIHGGFYNMFDLLLFLRVDAVMGIFENPVVTLLVNYGIQGPLS